MPSCPKDSGSVSVRRGTDGSYQFIATPCGTAVPADSTSPSNPSEWPASLGSQAQNNGIKISADGCLWSLPQSYGICLSDSTDANFIENYTTTQPLTVWHRAQLTVTNTTPYTMCVTSIHRIGHAEWRDVAGHFSAVGMSTQRGLYQVSHNGGAGSLGWPQAGMKFSNDINTRITFAYEGVLGRAVDPAALAHWITVLTADATASPQQFDDDKKLWDQVLVESEYDGSFDFLEISHVAAPQVDVDAFNLAPGESKFVYTDAFWRVSLFEGTPGWIKLAGGVSVHVIGVPLAPGA